MKTSVIYVPDPLLSNILECEFFFLAQSQNRELGAVPRQVFFFFLLINCTRESLKYHFVNTTEVRNGNLQKQRDQQHSLRNTCQLRMKCMFDMHVPDEI